MPTCAEMRWVPFRFTMIGDQGTDETPVLPPGLARGDYDDAYYKPDDDPTAPHTANVLNQIVAANPDFHVLAGDIAYADPSGAGQAADVRPVRRKLTSGFDKFNPFVWDVYFGSIEASASTTPWMFATGNHDMEAAYPTHGYGGHLARLDFPGNGPAGCPSVYSFVYGNVAVLSLDANDVSYEITANTGYSGGAQNRWVERTLAAYRADPNIDFIVCFFHHCAYSTTAAHASDGGVRTAWTALFDRYQVDLVLQGHNHVFERTDPIRANARRRSRATTPIVYPEPTAPSTTRSDAADGRATTFSPASRRATAERGRRTRSCPTATSGPPAGRTPRRSAGRGSGFATMRSFASTSGRALRQRDGRGRRRRIRPRIRQADLPARGPLVPLPGATAVT